MFRLKFPSARRQALAQTVDQLRRLQQLRRLLAEVQPPVRQVLGKLPGA